LAGGDCAHWLRFSHVKGDEKEYTTKGGNRRRAISYRWVEDRAGKSKARKKVLRGLYIASQEDLNRARRVRCAAWGQITSMHRKESGTKDTCGGKSVNPAQKGGISTQREVFKKPQWKRGKKAEETEGARELGIKRSP